MKKGILNLFIGCVLIIYTIIGIINFHDIVNVLETVAVLIVSGLCMSFGIVEIKEYFNMNR